MRLHLPARRFRRFADLWSPRLRRDVLPGNAFYARLADLRAAVAAKLAGTSPPAWSQIIDNTSGGFRASANWGVFAYSADRYGADYRYATPVAAIDSAYYAATLPEAGTHRLEVRHPANAGYNASTPHVVFASTGNQTVSVNQQANGGTWRSLGTFPFESGTRVILAVSPLDQRHQVRDRGCRTSQQGLAAIGRAPARRR